MVCEISDVVVGKVVLETVDVEVSRVILVVVGVMGVVDFAAIVESVEDNVSVLFFVWVFVLVLVVSLSLVLVLPWS
jgi:hypothetical protein